MKHAVFSALPPGRRPMVTDHAASTSIKPVRLLHTSDWHLGHELFGHTREVEHEAFLTWLSDTLEQTQTDALLVTGDIYDVANPSVPAQQRLYRFIAQLRQRLPRLQIVIIPSLIHISEPTILRRTSFDVLCL